MKGFLILVVCIATVFGENCNHDDDCHLVHCSTGSVNCIHRICTCTENTGQMCTGRDDCSFHCFHGQPHCVDGVCHCYGD
ncbi:uncharacterized protein LOC111105578 [Crassostrea virginica]|uniref:Serine protease inhibitor Cvsi-2-like n=1 Tax=Crassostrea virginica TaxID=6565 RepID=A0A8B8AWM6_CRAVI|nr:serine protease inhibitor Cvsi-2-like [Crassostrea virginica]